MRIILIPIIICIHLLATISSARAFGVREVSISSTASTSNIESREGMIRRLLTSRSFFGFTQERLDISIDHMLVEPRGRMKGRSITLSSGVSRDSEFLKLFVHEMGHFVDIYVYIVSGGKDISSEFYGISWQNTTTKRAGQKQQNFVSGYAATNQYEDFAESFVFYIFHNRVFQERALRDDVMRQKYLFIQREIFPSGIFVDTDFSLGRIPTYTWDTTKLPISLQKYLYSLN